MILPGPIKQVIHRQYLTHALFATDYSNINLTDFKEELRQCSKGLEHVLLKSGKIGLQGNIISKWTKKREERDIRHKETENAEKGDIKMSKSEKHEAVSHPA